MLYFSVCVGLLVSVLAVDNTPIDKTLFVPEVTRILNREFESIVEFTPGHISQNGEDVLPDRVESFLIEFGPVTQDFPFVIRQTRPIGQMQLLDEGVLNRGRIFSIGKSLDGKSVVKSPSSEVFYFKSDSTEVNKIREQVVFFDDFNGDAGDFDERRWNVAFTACSLAKTANFPVNNQKHIHTQVGAFVENCPLDQMTARARAVFDFTDRTGKIFLDHDGGSFVGHEFFLDVAEGAADLALGADEKNVVRVKIDNSQLEVQQILPDGTTVVLPGSEVNLFPRGDETYSVTNVRRPWVMEINKNEMSLDINGVRVLDKIQFQEPLVFEKGNVMITHQGVKSLQQGHHAVTMHLDNIGFDGPEPQLQTLNYRNVQQKAFKKPNLQNPFTIDVPEADANTVDGKARLVFTTMFQTNFEGNVLFHNGQEIAIPPPDTLPSSVLEPVNHVIEVDAIDVAGLANTIAFAEENTGFVGNVHLELDFGCQEVQVDERPFTVPNSQGIFASSFPISFNCDQELLARPVLEIKSINGRAPVAKSFKKGLVRAKKGRRAVAVAQVVVDMFSDRQLRHNGGSNGLKTLQMLVDCRVVQEVELDGAAFQLLDFKFNVVIEGSGTKEVYFRVLDNAGRSSTLGLATQVGRGVDEEIYEPLFINPSGRDIPNNKPICPNDVIFVGGDCEDIPVFTLGIQALSVCDDVPTVNTEFVRSNSRGLLGVNSTAGPRVPPRSELTNGYRRMGGYVGDWEEKGLDIPTTVDPDAPPYDPKDCDVSKFAACVDGPLEQAPAAAWGNRGTGPNGIKHWIERDATEPHEVEPVAEELASAIVSAGSVSKGSYAQGQINRGIYKAPSTVPLTMASVLAVVICYISF